MPFCAMVTPLIVPAFAAQSTVRCESVWPPETPRASSVAPEATFTFAAGSKPAAPSAWKPLITKGMEP